MNLSSVALCGEGSSVGNIEPVTSAPRRSRQDGSEDLNTVSTVPRQSERDLPEHRSDLLAMLSFALSVNIPHVNFDGQEGVLQRAQPWLVVPERLIHVLGSGASCTVSLHEIADDFPYSGPTTKLVVLKRYHRILRSGVDDEKRAQKRLYNLIWQDLRALTHPYLKTHENIVKLLYLAWQSENLIPVFALEHARYGTLDEFQRRNGNVISLTQGLNLSVDIVSGIAALHLCDFIHGDIKPSNILICEHVERGVVAKVTDFAGSAHSVEFGSANHVRFETVEWAAPEVIRKETNIDWKKADVYSLGLVLAHIWYPPNLAGSCFLHHLMCILEPDFYKYSRDRQLASMTHFKDVSSREEHKNHEILLATLLEIVNRTSAQKHFRNDLPGFDFNGFIKKCLEASLKSDCLQRCTVLELLNSMHDPKFVWHRRNNDSVTDSLNAAKCESEQLPPVASRLSTELVLTDEFGERSRCFHQAVVFHLERLLDTSARELQGYTSFSNEKDVEYELSVLRWLQANDAEVQPPGTPQELAAAHWWTLGQLYLLGMGTLQDSRKAIDAMVEAARRRMIPAMAVLPGLMASAPPIWYDGSADVTMLWLIYGMQYGYGTSTAQMRKSYPMLYRTISRIFVSRLLFSLPIERWLIAFGKTTRDFYEALISYMKMNLQAVRIARQSLSLLRTTSFGGTVLHTAAGFADMKVLSWLLDVTARSEIDKEDLFGRTPAWFAIESQSPHTLSMLLAHGADASHSDGKGQTLLHRTVLLEDSIACTMARLLLAKGAALNVDATDVPDCGGISVPRFGRATGTPLVWAVYRNKPGLFALLLREHARANIEVDSLTWWSILQRAAIYHHVDMVECGLALLQSFPWMRGAQQAFKSPNLLQFMLRWSVHEASYHTMGCRVQLGAEFLPKQAEFIKRIISLGGDPLSAIDANDSPMTYALSQGDAQAVEIFFADLEAKGINPYTILMTDEHRATQHGFMCLVQAQCIDAFHWALQRYPDIVKLPLRGKHGRALHVATYFGQYEHVRALLEAGADRHAVDDVTSATALEIAVENGKLDIADLLVQGANVTRLLGTPSAYGNTLFGRLLNRTFEIKTRVNISTFKWLKKHDAIQFYPNILVAGLSLWWFLFSRRFVARRDIANKDLELLSFLLQPDTFLNRIKETDVTGMAAIHYAARWGNFESIELLVSRGADINQGVAYGSVAAFRAPPTATPLELATIAACTPPDDVKSGGTNMIKLWKEDCKNKIEYIAKKGGLRGEYHCLIDRALFGSEWFDPDITTGRDEASWSSNDGLDETHGQWPAKLQEHLSATTISAESPKTDARFDYGLWSISESTKVEHDAPDSPDESNEIAEAVSRMAAGTGTREDSLELLAWARGKLTECNAQHPLRTENICAPSSQSPPVYDGNERALPRVNEKRFGASSESVREEVDDVEEPERMAEILHEDMRRYGELLRQPRIREYVNAKAHVMREHGMNVETGRQESSAAA